MRSFTPPKPCSYFPASSKGVKIKHVRDVPSLAGPVWRDVDLTKIFVFAKEWEMKKFEVSQPF